MTLPTEVEQSSGSGLYVVVAAQTDTGSVREANEDSFQVVEPTDPGLMATRGRLLVVADGMGGSVGGATASALVAGKVEKSYYQSTEDHNGLALANAVREANHSIYEFARENRDLKGMGSTCTAVVIHQFKVYYAHVGDTRLYLIRDRQILPMTDDHSRVAQEVRDGTITLEMAEVREDKNVLLRALGPKPDVEVDVDLRPVELRNGDRLLLCSDGLTNLVSDREMLQMAEQYPIEQTVQFLINLANERGGHDNITVVMAQVTDQPGGRSSVPKTEVRTFESEHPTGMASSMGFYVFAGIAALILIGLLVGLAMWSGGEDGTAAGAGADASEGSDVLVAGKTSTKALTDRQILFQQTRYQQMGYCVALLNDIRQALDQATETGDDAKSVSKKLVTSVDAYQQEHAIEVPTYLRGFAEAKTLRKLLDKGDDVKISMLMADKCGIGDDILFEGELSAGHLMMTKGRYYDNEGLYCPRFIGLIASALVDSGFLAETGDVVSDEFVIAVHRFQKADMVDAPVEQPRNFGFAGPGTLAKLLGEGWKSQQAKMCTQRTKRRRSVKIRTKSGGGIEGRVHEPNPPSRRLVPVTPRQPPKKKPKKKLVMP